MRSSAPRQSGQPRPPAVRTPTVCVVDPQANDYPSWDALAEANGARLECVPNGEEGLRFARTNEVDLWVINTALPGLSGYELCDMLKRRQSRTAVYLVANEYTPDSEHRALRHRATLFGCKGGHIEWLRQWLLQVNSIQSTNFD